MKIPNNEVLRRISEVLSLDAAGICAIFSQAQKSVTEDHALAMLSKPGSAEFAGCDDSLLATLLNGLINERRGKKEGAQPELESQLTNNMIFMKLRIAFDLKTDDLVTIFKSVDVELSKHEVSSLFRKPGQKHHKKCSDAVLRQFFDGLHKRVNPL